VGKAPYLVGRNSVLGGKLRTWWEETPYLVGRNSVLGGKKLRTWWEEVFGVRPST